MRSAGDLARLEPILELIAMVERRLAGLSWDRFDADRDEIDLTAYRLLHIGENANKLSATMKERHPEIAWTQIYRMRNVISHSYAAILAELLWGTANHDLPARKAACQAELGYLRP